jgi:hypothetical protein
VRRNFVALIGAPLIGALVLFHACMVFVVNMPGSRLKSAVAPVLSRYDGPQLSQGWLMFAPNPPQSNVHVLVRGRATNGQMTPWYDATLYFVDVVRKDRLDPSREVGEGLAHAAFIAARSRNDAVADAFIFRTGAMILDLYASHAVNSEQIEIESISIPPPGYTSAVTRAIRFPWQHIPSVARL